MEWLKSRPGFRSEIEIEYRAARSGRTEARSGLRMMPTFPPSSLRCRTAGFPRYGSKAGLSDGAFPALSPVKPAPGGTPCQLRFASTLRVSRGGLRTPFRVGASFSVKHHHSTDFVGLPQGLLAPVRVMLSRSLVSYWPHPPYSQAHRSFVALRLICDAFAVRERLGDPRVVPRFRCIVPSQHVALCVPGEAVAAYTQFLRDKRWPSPRAPNSSALPTVPDFGAYEFAFAATC